MRRKEKEILDRTEIDRIIESCPVCHLGMAKDNVPYVVPLNFGYDGRYLYFHCARSGRKLDYLSANRRVCFQMECRLALAAPSDQACEWSFAFDSVIGEGVVEEVQSSAEKHQAVLQIVQHYGNGHVAPEHLARVRVFRILIETISAKRSRP